MNARPFAGLLAATTAVAALLSGCATSTPNASKPKAAVSRSCGPAQLQTVREGKLTVATDNPALEPWYAGNDPSSGAGLEAGVAYAVAVQLGYHPHNVVWRRVPFRSIIAAGQKPFDLALDEVTIRPERARNVDFSTAYFSVNQAVLGRREGKFTEAKSLADLRDARLGALAGTTSLAAITGRIKPTTAPTSFASMSEAIEALNTGQVDAIVTDLPTAFEMAGTRVTAGRVIGQLPPQGGEEKFGVVVPKGSAMKGCVDQALTALRKDGTLRHLDDEWTVHRGAPRLQ